MARIVLIDDELAVRQTLSRILERAGHDVVCYAEAASALQDCDFATVDIVVTDLWMPTSGEDFVTEIRDLGVRIPILVLTGRLEIDQDEIMSIGADRVMQKPVRADQLMDAIETVLADSDVQQ